MTKGDDVTGAESKAKVAARQRKWRSANPPTPEQKAKAAARSRKWRQANKPRAAAYLKGWRDSQGEQILAQDEADQAVENQAPRSPL
ncbi:hypothetical protein [Phyllobacterium sp. P5_D12]